MISRKTNSLMPCLQALALFLTATGGKQPAPFEIHDLYGNWKKPLNLLIACKVPVTFCARFALPST
jgi:hypothetical protein